MIEKLQAYRAELVQAKSNELAKDSMPEIEAKVADFRAQLIAEDEAAKLKIVTKIDSDIDCIDYLIQRESDKVLAAAETAQANTVTLIR